MINNPDLGKLILRLALGLLILLHGIDKLFTGVGWIGQQLAAHHLPEFLAFGVFIGELVAPVMVIFGLHTRVGAALIAGNMLVAIVLVHMGQIASLGQHGGWALELQGMYLFTALALLFLGGGKYVLKK